MQNRINKIKLDLEKTTLKTTELEKTLVILGEKPYRDVKEEYNEVSKQLEIEQTKLKMLIEKLDKINNNLQNKKIIKNPNFQFIDAVVEVSAGIRTGAEVGFVVLFDITNDKYVNPTYGVNQEDYENYANDYKLDSEALIDALLSLDGVNDHEDKTDYKIMTLLFDINSGKYFYPIN
jgi:hypothetical protein